MACQSVSPSQNGTV